MKDCLQDNRPAWGHNDPKESYNFTVLDEKCLSKICEDDVILHEFLRLNVIRRDIYKRLQAMQICYFAYI